VAALPVAFEQSAAALRPAVDRLEVIILSDQLPFAVANFYGNWYDVGDDEVKALLARSRQELSRPSSRE